MTATTTGAVTFLSRAERDLRDYFRLPTAETKARIAELVEAGELLEVEVEDWGRTQGYLDASARIPHRCR